MFKWYLSTNQHFYIIFNKIYAHEAVVTHTQTHAYKLIKVSNNNWFSKSSTWSIFIWCIDFILNKCINQTNDDPLLIMIEKRLYILFRSSVAKGFKWWWNN
jgi:hypothetical protein